METFSQPSPQSGGRHAPMRSTRLVMMKKCTLFRTRIISQASARQESACSRKKSEVMQVKMLLPSGIFHPFLPFFMGSAKSAVFSICVGSRPTDQISSVHIAMGAAFADFPASVPWIPGILQTVRLPYSIRAAPEHSISSAALKAFLFSGFNFLAQGLQRGFQLVVVFHVHPRMDAS